MSAPRISTNLLRSLSTHAAMRKFIKRTVLGMPRILRRWISHMAAIVIHQLFFDFKRPREAMPVFAAQAFGHGVNIYPVPLCWKFCKKVEYCQ